MSTAPLYPSFTTTYHHDQYPAIDPRQPALDCSGKYIFITGGGSGIGQAIAIAFAQAHAAGITLLGRTQAPLDATAVTIHQVSNGRTRTFVVLADIMWQPQVASALASATAHFDNHVPDVLVNNAGGLHGVGSLTDVALDDFWRSFELNVKGPLIVAQTYLRANARHSPDAARTVINIPSGAAHLPYAPGACAYATAKLASAKIAEYLHHENPSWNVFNMQPGVVRTNLSKGMTRPLPDSADLAGGLAVWLATQARARVFNGRFLWANWDVDELLAIGEEIQKRDLLTLTLKGWAEDVSAEELKQRAASVAQKSVD